MDDDVRRQDPREPPHEHGARRAGHPSAHRLPRVALDVDVRDLTPRVDARVGPARDREPRRRAAQDRPECRLERALDGPQAGLRRPARERGAVVREVQADPEQGVVHAPNLATGQG
ncbi:hypothetical protein N868_12135 [Cellulomonas carbonis T26]|uniref:Uncharacterized protein n=1 Tax=Cellulomonas carbonis T26 TaxID=947969 RepID=A0A0A0BT62_9CELL|nr:hypothetical protein N868_12135 [Cellulomonas carbonis T26]